MKVSTKSTLLAFSTTYTYKNKDLFLPYMQATVRRDSPHQNVMQTNTVRILREMNYEEVEPHLISYFIISFDERRDLTKETSRDQKMFIIDKVIKGTEETFHNFLRALEDSEDESNRNLMIHLQHAHQIKGRTTPWCESEMLNTLSSLTQDELVLRETPILTRTNSKSSYSSTHSFHSGVQYQSKTEQERTRSTTTSQSDSQDDTWVLVYSQTNITYSKNLTLVMEYICDKMIDTLTETSSAQSIFTEVHNISLSIKLSKNVYLAADPETATGVTRAADDQVRQSHKLLMKILHKLQHTSHPRISIDLDPILQKIDYSPDKIILSECSIEGLIQAVKKLNQPTTHRQCVIL